MLIEFLVAFLIAAICVTLHITILLRVVEGLLPRRDNLDRPVRYRHLAPLLIFVFAVMTALSVLEASIWAVFYRWFNLFPDWETALYFSLGTYTTIGYGDVVLPRTWRLLGAI